MLHKPKYLLKVLLLQSQLVVQLVHNLILFLLALVKQQLYQIHIHKRLPLTVGLHMLSDLSVKRLPVHKPLMVEVAHSLDLVLQYRLQHSQYSEHKPRHSAHLKDTPTSRPQQPAVPLLPHAPSQGHVYLRVQVEGAIGLGSELLVVLGGTLVDQHVLKLSVAARDQELAV